MTHVRAMFVGQGRSGMPEDRFINTWHFIGGSDYTTDSGNAVALLQEFYSTDGGDYNSVGKFLSPWLEREADIVTYDLDTAQPRIPTHNPTTLGTALSADGLPEEVAVCMSFRGAIPPGVTARRRGRIFLGPLCRSAMTDGSTSSFSHPSSPFVHAITSAATRLIEHGVTLGCTWQIRSSVGTPTYSTVDTGYVDDAFDTQRRRGPKTTARTPFA